LLLGLSVLGNKGLADEVRTDVSVMKDLAIHTRVGPADRVKRLQKFINDITRSVYCVHIPNVYCVFAAKGWIKIFNMFYHYMTASIRLVIDDSRYNMRQPARHAGLVSSHNVSDLSTSRDCSLVFDVANDVYQVRQFW